MKYVASLLVLFFNLPAIGQIDEPIITTSVSSIYGKVVDEKTKKGLDAVSVQLYRVVAGENNSYRDTLINGMFTRGNGDFKFSPVPLNDSLVITVTAIGFKKYVAPVQMKSSKSVAQVDLGNIAMTVEAQTLQTVTVVATVPTFQMGIDRKIFNVDKNITATGGTAVDVMKNIPSVTVDVEGNVQLRNAAPQIFIDGRPTILTLDQIPADNIDKVELITNPSAKFDAASAGGIINVVLKKNRRFGMNGLASVSAGSPGVLGGNVTLNLRQNKFNFFVSGNYYKSGGNADGKTYRENKVNGSIDNYFNQVSSNKRGREYKSARFGFDYFIDNRNTLTLSEYIVDGNFTGNEHQTQEYLDAQRSFIKSGIRSSIGNSGFNRSGTHAVYTHKFAENGRQFSIDGSYNSGSGDNLTNITNNYYNLSGTEYSPVNRVRNIGENKNSQYTVQVDYEHPIGDKMKFETGLRTYGENNNNIFDAYSIADNGAETKLSLSNHYEFKQQVNAFYSTFSNKINKFSYQAGLRAETSKLNGELLDRGQKFGYNYPANLKNIWDGLFPSLFLTQALTDRVDIQLNYSRRIRRPNFWQLNPYIDINDPVNIRQGNPNLRPEFTNSFEFNYNNNYSGGNFLASVYMRNTLGDITQYSDTITAEQLRQLNNSAVDPNAILNTYINSKSQNRLGLDLTWQQKFGNLELIPNFNLQFRKVNADVNNLNLSNQGWNWESKLIANYKFADSTSWLFKNLGFQLTGEYESPEVIPQGKRKERYSIDFAFRKELLDKKGTLTFSVDDIFNTRRYGSIYDTESFYQDSYSRRNVRSFRVTFSYKFGDANFSLFKRKSRSGADKDEDEAPETTPPAS